MDESRALAGRDAEQRAVILLSSYNGASFIAEQIESIRRQTLESWHLLVRDDGSSDDTVGLVQSLAASDARIRLLRDDRGNLGPARSFGVLMEAALSAGAEYVAFADQDDVWHADKLEHEVGALRRREAEVGAAVPLLVHTDLTVVDEALRCIDRSFMAFQGLDQDGGAPLPWLLAQNFVTGCTTVINRALLRAALPLQDIVMHDWWLALCAAALGEILYLPRATVLYRQHDRNAAGSRWWMHASLDAALHPLRWLRSSRTTFSATVAQACALARRVERESPGGSRGPASLATVREYCQAFSTGTGALGRLRTVWRHRVRPRSSLGYPLFFYARVALWPAGGHRPCGADSRGDPCSPS
jgi:glycosyltransferase involved in cell wall biosynthesis